MWAQLNVAIALIAFTCADWIPISCSEMECNAVPGAEVTSEVVNTCFYDVAAAEQYYYMFQILFYPRYAFEDEFELITEMCEEELMPPRVQGKNLRVSMLSINSELEKNFLTNEFRKMVHHFNGTSLKLSKHVLLGISADGWVDNSSSSYIETIMDISNLQPATKRVFCLFFSPGFAKDFTMQPCRALHSLGEDEDDVLLAVCKSRIHSSFFVEENSRLSKELEILRQTALKESGTNKSDASETKLREKNNIIALNGTIKGGNAILNRNRLTFLLRSVASVSVAVLLAVTDGSLFP